MDAADTEVATGFSQAVTTLGDTVITNAKAAVSGSSNSPSTAATPTGTQETNMPVGGPSAPTPKGHAVGTLLVGFFGVMIGQVCYGAAHWAHMQLLGIHLMGICMLHEANIFIGMYRDVLALCLSLLLVAFEGHQSATIR